MLKEILNVVKLRGNREVNEVKVITKDKKSYINVISADESVVVSLVTEKPLLEKEETIGIVNIGALIQYLNLVSKDYTYGIKGNRLTIKDGKKKLATLLKAPDFVKTFVEDKKVKILSGLVEGGDTIKVEVDKLKIVETYMKTTGLDYFKLKLGKNEAEITIDNENTDNINDVIEIIGEGKTTLLLGESFLDAISGLTGEITIVAKEEAPVLISQKTKDYEVIILVGQKDEVK